MQENRRENRHRKVFVHNKDDTKCAESQTNQGQWNSTEIADKLIEIVLGL